MLQYTVRNPSVLAIFREISLLTCPDIIVDLQIHRLMVVVCNVLTFWFMSVCCDGYKLSFAFYSTDLHLCILFEELLGREYLR